MESNAEQPDGTPSHASARHLNPGVSGIPDLSQHPLGAGFRGRAPATPHSRGAGLISLITILPLIAVLIVAYCIAL